MGAWYWIGVAAGIGVGAGVLLAGLVGSRRTALVAYAVAAVVAGAAIGYGFDVWQSGSWGDVALGAVGGLVGLLAATLVVTGALRRGGTRGGTALLVAGAAVVIAALAWIPGVGYLELLLLPLLALRIRRRRPDRHAGLRTLARD